MLTRDDAPRLWRVHTGTYRVVYSVEDDALLGWSSPCGTGASHTAPEEPNPPDRVFVGGAGGDHDVVLAELPRPRSLWLLRHAESEGNRADARALDAQAERLELIARDADMPLSDTGREQAQALGRAWSHLEPDDRPSVVLCSPYERALSTVQVAIDTAGWDLSIVRDERLRERDLGALDGFTRHGIERNFPDEAKRRAWVGKFYYRPPGGESWADVAGRVRAVVESAEVRYAGERLLLVSHQAVVMVSRYVVEALTEQEILEIDETEAIANTALVRYEYEGGTPRLVAFNDTSHLEERDAPVTEEPDAASLSS